MKISTTDFRKKMFTYGNMVFEDKKRITVSKSGIPYFDIVPHSPNPSNLEQIAGSVKVPPSTLKKQNKKSFSKIRNQAWDKITLRFNKK